MATSAMLEADRRERSFILYDDKMYSEAFRRLELESAAYRALEQHQFELNFQPIVDDRFRIVGAEALIRWKHPTMGQISPMDFIPIAEQSDLIFSIGKWVLYSVCSRITEWSIKYGIYVSMNMSSREFSSPTIISDVKNVLEKFPDLDAGYLKIEITENECLDDINYSIVKINELAGMGIEIYIDDFGTGNSSLQYLKNLPAKVLKIDQTFVTEIETNNNEREFLQDIIHMAKIRGKEALIEGVENKAQAYILIGMGCNKLQGYNFSKPLDAEAFEALLERGIRGDSD
jgi:EAL domain-containing protein (putative c-di-GMP-specific phosphodiesterase class I)